MGSSLDLVELSSSLAQRYVVGGMSWQVPSVPSVFDSSIIHRTNLVVVLSTAEGVSAAPCEPHTVTACPPGEELTIGNPEVDSTCTPCGVSISIN